MADRIRASKLLNFYNVNMHLIGKKDSIVELTDLPHPLASAPVPFILSDEHLITLAYIAGEGDAPSDGTSIKLLGPETSNVLVAVLRFSRYRSFTFGSPNDEALRGHPLASRGLRSYSIFEVKHSSWIEQLKEMNSVHPRHMPEVFDDYRHFVITFQDSTFECVAKTVENFVYKGSLKSVLLEMNKCFFS